jgi:hypothetical protein
VQERFCKGANVVVVIVERRQEFLVCGQFPFGAPLQVASKQVQSVAMFNLPRHVSQVDPFVVD